MGPRIVDRLTAARARLTPVERSAIAALALAWAVGTVLRATGADQGLAARVSARLDPPLPTAEALAAALSPDDPRAGWYAAGLALRDERGRAGSPPEPIDPNAADRADWDRLPGVGPRTAIAIVEHRVRHGPFRQPEDLLAIRGIGPVRLERLRPWLAWPAGPARPVTREGAAEAAGALPPNPPDLNRVDAAFLEGLPKIGPQLARQILEERGARRGFRDWSDLLAVEGVGPARLRVLQNATRLGVPFPGENPTIAREERK
ncbi:MAG TPA: helix-hairpin-helix domain-containing protein [Gemmatimonadota bacterium]|nr:helix-hairpin-helix domain-containing protein [Gemmatimonadota bacterium]